MSATEKFNLHRNLSLRDAVHIAERMGLVVEGIRRTGEARVRFPWRGAPLKFNNRRADAPRKLLSLLRQHQARIKTTEGGGDGRLLR